jgi:hypothetical protein
MKKLMQVSSGGNLNPGQLNLWRKVINSSNNCGCFQVAVETSAGSNEDLIGMLKLGLDGQIDYSKCPSCSVVL